MKHFFISALLLFFSILAYSQSNYKPGLIVTHQGDTLRGFINFKEWEENPVEISFKAAITEKATQEFTTKKCQYFSITGLESYVRYEGEVSADRIDLDNLPTRISTKTRYVSTFLKVLQQGAYISLYSFTDLLKTRYFLQEGKTGVIEELAFKKYLDVNNNIASVNLYTKSLALMAAKYKPDDDDLIRQINNSTYNGVDLLRIVSLINGLSLSQIALIEKTNYKIALFAGVGVNRSITMAYPENGKANQYYKGSTLPKIYFGFDTFLNPKVQRLVFRGETTVAFVNHDVELISSPKFRDILKYNSIVISAVPQILYNIYNAERVKCYVGAGIAGNYSVYSKLKYSAFEVDLNGVEKEHSRERDLYKFRISVPVRAGIILNQHLDIGLQYFLRSYVSDYSSFAFSSLSLQANYFFNRK